MIDTLRVLRRTCCYVALCSLTGLAAALAQESSFVNWESPHVHPLELTPDGSTLLAVNTPDNRLEVFDVEAEGLVSRGSVPVGLDPVSVRARTNSEVWVINHISDSVSIVDLEAMSVVATLSTADEPADVVFAGTPERAFVSCSQANQVLVFDLDFPRAPPQVIQIDAEDPRAMAVSPAGDEIYVAIFESGNGTTLVGGGLRPEALISYPPDAVSHPDGPYQGTNPPPNVGDEFVPAMSPENPPPPGVSLIVRRSPEGVWQDDNGADWSRFVSGTDAALSGRVEGWDLIDHDLAVINTATLDVRYAGGLMNACMALAVNPVVGWVTVVGTEALNDVRFEPNLQAQFVRVHSALVDPAAPTTLAVEDLNPHLDYSVPTLPQSERELALGDPRGLVWNADGTRAWVTGMGSSNVVELDAATGERAADTTPISVGAGPTGIVYDSGNEWLYVLNKFDASVSVIDSVASAELARVDFFDPTPIAIRDGRSLLYDTHETSGLGQVSCASCHIDARFDRLAWDLGNPEGPMRSLARRNRGMGIPPLVDADFVPYHPMKGPMLTQTLQDIIGKEPFHWRGDQDGIEGFSDAYANLLGRQEKASDAEMQLLKGLLASLHFPPNPFRDLDNALPTDLPLPGQYSDGRFTPAGEPLPNGNALRALDIFRRAPKGGLACSTCHTLTTGMSTDSVLGPDAYQNLPTGPDGEHHHGLVALRGIGTGVTKVAQLRNLYDRVGCEATQTRSRAGFGYLHDGGFDSLARFVSDRSFFPADEQEVADLVALLLSFSGSDLPQDLLFPREAPGTESQDTHAAVGRQLTITAAPLAAERTLVSSLVTLAEAGKIGLVAKGIRDGIPRGFTYVSGGRFQADRSLERPSLAELVSGSGAGTELTLTAVPRGSEQRIGIDRDEDGAWDRDEIDAGSNPDDPTSMPVKRPSIF